MIIKLLWKQYQKQKPKMFSNPKHAFYAMFLLAKESGKLSDLEKAILEKLLTEELKQENII